MTNEKSCWDLANLIIGKTNRILLYGAPGTGKTYSAVKQNAPLKRGHSPFSIASNLIKNGAGMSIL